MSEKAADKKHRRKLKRTGFYWTILLNCLILLFSFFLITSQKTQSVSADTPVVDLILATPSPVVPAGASFPVTVEAQCNGQEILGVEVHLNFDPLFLNVQSINPGKTLDVALQNEYDNSLGTLSYSAGTLTTPLPNQNFTVATITFNGLRPAVKKDTKLVFNLVPPRETGVTAGSTSVLRNAVDLMLTILPDTPAPGSFVPVPTKTAFPNQSPPPTTSILSTPTASTPAKPIPPTIATVNVTGTTTNTATLNGSLAGTGSASEIAISIEWGTSETYGQTTPVQIVSDLNGYSFHLSGLEPGKSYHFRMKAKGDGEVFTGDDVFTTLTETPSPLAATPSVEPPVLKPEPVTGPSLTPSWLSGTWLWVLIAAGATLFIAAIIFFLKRNR